MDRLILLMNYQLPQRIRYYFPLYINTQPRSVQEVSHYTMEMSPSMSKVKIEVVINILTLTIVIFEIHLIALKNV